MFLHKHPYEPFVLENATHLIVGTIPPPRFSTGSLEQGDVDFNYGSRYNLLWPVLAKIYCRKFVYKSSEQAVEQRKRFLEEQGIGICDLVMQCEREKNDASDIGMKNIVFRDVIAYLNKIPTIHTLLFMGRSVELLFRKYLKSKNVVLIPIRKTAPRIHELRFEDRMIRTVTLIAPSQAANRAIGGVLAYKFEKRKNPHYSPLDFRVSQYQVFFPEIKK